MCSETIQAQDELSFDVRQTDGIDAVHYGIGTDKASHAARRYDDASWNDTG